ncbi:MAG: carboxypeptidase-like regulatory domain-containing protein [Ekhidna sp.]
MKLKLSSIFLSLLIVFTSFSQSEIRGKVVDSELRDGLLGAHVYFMKNWRVGTITEMDGSFSLPIDPQYPNDSLIISFIGFEEMVVAAKDGLTIVLKSIQIDAGEVVITAEPLIAEEFKYIKIKKLDVYTNPAAKADPILAVNSLPSATTTDESANISLRGSSPLETGTFLNNVPIYDAVRYSQLNGIGTFSIFNTAIIKDLAVFSGNPPLEFGNTTAGAISLTTDDYILDGNSNSLILSLANIGFSREQKLNKKQSLKLFTNWQPSAAIKAINSKALESIKSFNSGDFGAYWYGGKEKLTWKVLSYSLLENYQFNYQHPSYQGTFEQTKKRSFLVSSLTLHTTGGEFSINNGLSISDANYGYSKINIDVIKKDFFGGINFLESNTQWSFKSGISYDYRTSTSNGNYHEFYYAQDTIHPTLNFDGEEKATTFDGFVYLKYYLSEKWALGSGLRKNIPINGQRNYLSRQLNLAFNDSHWTLILGGGKYFKHGLIENTGEAFSAVSDQVSVDVKYTKPRYSLALSLFDKDNSLDGMDYKARGAELFAEYKIGQKLNGSSSFTWLDASNKNSSDNFQYDLSYFIRSNLAYNPGKFWTIEGTFISREGVPSSLVSSASFDSDLAVYEPTSFESKRLNNYANLSLSLSKIFSISEKLNVIAFCSLNNVFDKKNERGFNYNFDYSTVSTTYYSRRTGYVGAIFNW